MQKYRILLTPVPSATNNGTLNAMRRCTMASLTAMHTGRPCVQMQYPCLDGGGEVWGPLPNMTAPTALVPRRHS